jgi:hypothetical protein
MSVAALLLSVAHGVKTTSCGGAPMTDTSVSDVSTSGDASHPLADNLGLQCSRQYMVDQFQLPLMICFCGNADT